MYLDMLQQWLMRQLQEDKVDFILQRDGVIFLETSVITLMLNFQVVGLDVLLKMAIPFFSVLSHLT